MMQCVDLNDDLRERVSSATYVKDPTFDTPVKGVWREVAAITGGSTSYNYSLTTTSTDKYAKKE